MGFYPQPNDWTCGPFALKHALAALGQTASEDDIARRARTHWWSGTDEIRLAEAATAYDCDLEYERKVAPEPARRALTGWLRERTPVLLCVDEWGHWIAVLREHQGQFVIVDSLLDPVLDVLTWPQLRRRWVYHDVDYDEETPPTVYDFFAVVPRVTPRARADFSVARVRHLRRAENRKLAEHWDDYLGDLLDICRPQSSRMNEPLSMGEFLRRNQEILVSRTIYWQGDVDRAPVERLLANFRFVAETYGLVIPSNSQRRAVTDLAVLVTMWIATTYGTAPMYGDGE